MKTPFERRQGRAFGALVDFLFADRRAARILAFRIVSEPRLTMTFRFLPVDAMGYPGVLNTRYTHCTC
jgi:hypothetical protein